MCIEPTAMLVTLKRCSWFVPPTIGVACLQVCVSLAGAPFPGGHKRAHTPSSLNGPTMTSTPAAAAAIMHTHRVCVWCVRVYERRARLLWYARDASKPSSNNGGHIRRNKMTHTTNRLTLQVPIHQTKKTPCAPALLLRRKRGAGFCFGAPHPSPIRARPHQDARGDGGGGARNGKVVTWLILPVVICLSKRLSHACVSINNFVLVRLRMAH